jgi:hypothetical protein
VTLTLFKKLINLFKNMITEGNLATAQLAQMFGSELLKVQKSSQTDSGSVPNIVRLDPKQFLYNEAHVSNQRRAEEQRIIQALQREAEAAYPIVEAQLPPQEQPPQSQRQEVPIQIQPSPTQQATTAKLSSAKGDVWASIAGSLERIANSLERVDVSVKKKRMKRATK